LPMLLIRFLFRSPDRRMLETVAATAEWVRHVTLIRMSVYRDVLRQWRYRERFGRLTRAATRLLPGWMVYRFLIRGRAAAELGAAARRNVQIYGERTRSVTGLSRAYQFADLLSVCLRHPGTFPNEYYAFGLYDPRHRHLAAAVVNAYQVDFVVS